MYQSYKIILPVVVLCLLTCLSCNQKLIPATSSSSDVKLWLTDPDAGVLFQQQESVPSFKNISTNYPEILIEVNKTYQTIDGFGFTLTGGSAMHLFQMDKFARNIILKELFSTEGASIGVSYLRISIGASDLDAAPFSYDDLPAGETDIRLEKFSIAPDKLFLIPILKEILAINPAVKILATPWSPPVWMKTNSSTVGGSLRAEYYDVYAGYFVKYIQAMQAEGIMIDAITVQNEPLHPGNNPSMLMTANEQKDFIKKNLGLAFKAAGIPTKIILYDHNANHPEYPLTILNDNDAAQYIDGSAFHLYAGDIDTLTSVHNAHPHKNLYFTEQWIGAPGNLKADLAWHIKNVIIGAMRNWCKVALEWNLASDSKLAPHTTGGCTECLGALTIDGDTVKRNPAYYIIAHAAKFIRPGSVRIYSQQPASLPNVAFKLPGVKIVLIVLNETDAETNFWIRQGTKSIPVKLNGGAVGTFLW